MNQLENPPIMRLFQLKLADGHEGEYEQVASNNLLNSFQKEKNTLMMAACHNPEIESEKIVFEVYKDEKAYQEHIQSQHFKDFASFAKEGFTDRQVLSLQAELLFEKDEAKLWQDAGTLNIRLAHLSIPLDQAEKFKTIVAEEMLKAIAVEEGVMSLFTGRDIEDLSQWYFFEVYQDQEAYEKHILTQHFKKYIAESAEIVEDKNLSVLSGEILISQGGTRYQK